jgi:DNA helicase-4
MNREECRELIKTLPNSISANEKAEIEQILKNIGEKFLKHNNKENQKMKLSEEQLKAINYEAKYILLKARAGSGKTEVLVQRTKRLLKSGIKSNEILLLAFNKNIANEMAERIGENFKNAKTFHSFAYSIVQPQNEILMDRKQLVFIQNLVNNECHQYHSINCKDIGNDELTQQFYNFSPEYFVKYIRNRSDISLSLEEMTNIKEKYIADFIFEHNLEAEDINLIDISDINLKKGSKEQREQFEENLNTGFNKIGKTIKKLSEKDIFNKMGFIPILKITEIILSFISNAKAKKLSPQDLSIKIDNYLHFNQETYSFLKFVNHIYSQYENSNKTDFQDLLIRATERIQEQNIHQLKHIFIDEFQDFSPLFYELIKKIVNIKKDINIFAVGDDWQGINGFAGAELKYFTNFDQYFKNAKILSMLTNYRSKSTIVEFSNNILSGEKAIASQNGGEIINKFNINDVINNLAKDKTLGIIVRSNYEKKELKLITKTDNVKILTAHKSKGLQYDEVIIWNKNQFIKNQSHKDNIFFKIFEKTDNEIIEEEKRLFYVAVTRAKDKLYIQ